MPYSLEDVQKAFALIDTNNDNLISAAEYIKMIKNNGMTCKNNQISDMFFSQKRSPPGYINFDEFSYYMLSGKNNDDLELEQAFNFFDRDKDGFITKSELNQALKKLGNDMIDNDLDEIIKSVDLDGDNKISYSEFVLLMNSNY